MGGHAGHFGSRALDSDPGWLSRNLVPHEISAVTGACLAVQRWKFERVGGFDAIHLPIDLNDVDLCLKLAEQGWSARLDPEVCLLHDESAAVAVAPSGASPHTLLSGITSKRAGALG